MAYLWREQRERTRTKWITIEDTLAQDEKSLAEGEKKACWISQLWTWLLHILPVFFHKFPKNLIGETLGSDGGGCLVANLCPVLLRPHGL